ncbi:MAG TPA: Stp1/IreP family PP2C-type Ser/Thr phosphatase [Rhodocyclaceae bacterium]|nr:Stp1/IreP family PP2C-type Ser/Thr phosphatase [Rhodocyclaceae bacterium]
MPLNLSVALEFASHSDPGRVRPRNEDSVLLDPALGLAVLADGMGGYNAGEVASGMAATLIGEGLAHAFAERGPADHDADGQDLAHAVFKREIARANEAILQAAQSQPQNAGMGTTLVAVLFRDDKVTVAHIGDSRLYRLRNGELRQLTRDHSLLQEQIDEGMLTAEEARFSNNKNLLTRALGVDPTVEAEVHDHDAKPGDLFLLCSDGLNDMVEDAEIASILTEYAPALDLCAGRLVDYANDCGGRDNVSVILVKVREAFPEPRNWWARLRAWFK